jgi:2-phosphosulfolactate phosphatase
MTTLEVLFTPAEFAALAQRDLSGTCCVVFDVLRATSSMVTALANGAEAVLPVAEIAEAVKLRQERPGVLLAGERDGVRIPAQLAGGTAFDLGNSPREFTPEAVRGRTIAVTTTNGTRALRACAHARMVLAAAFLNLTATAQFIGQSELKRLLIVCSGTYEEAAYEDVLGAGALCGLVWERFGGGTTADSAWLAWRLYRLEAPRLLEAISRSRNGRRLLGRPELRDDVAWCARIDTVPILARLEPSGEVRQFACV